MASVYKALHVRFHELRALKIMNPELASDFGFVTRFTREAVLTRQLQHPSAVRVDDIDEAEDGRPFIVMELIAGRSLREVIKEEAPLDLARTCSIVKQVASALEAAHRLGMVHRDIKPANIVLVGTGEGAALPHPFPPADAQLPLGQEVAKVLDFGIAKVKEGQLEDSRIGHITLTETGMVVGTPAYMSPEQALGKRGDQLDGRSDLYSLGIVMYEMLTGELPLKADTAMGLVVAHVHTLPKPIQQARPGLQIPDAIARLVMQCLEKNPERRPESAAAFIDALNRAMLARSLTATLPAGAIHEPPRPPSDVGPIHALPRAQSPQARAALSRLAKWTSPIVAALLIGIGAWVFVTSRAGVNGPAKTNSAEAKGESRISTATQPARSVTQTGSEVTPAGSGAKTHPPAAPAGGSEPAPPPQPKRVETPPHVASSVAKKLPAQSPPGATETRTSPTAATETKITPEQLAKQINAAKTEGDLFYENGEYDNAIAAYQKGLKLDPKNAELLQKIQKARNAKATESGPQ
jgi:serine/threonine-protein kinase